VGVATVGALLLLLIAGPPIALMDWVAARHPGCLYHVPVAERAVALTIDDGPDAATTPLILARLRQHGAKATFFLISNRVGHRAPLVAQIVGEGHEIGNHFTQDRPGIRLSTDAFTRDLEQAHAVLAAFDTVRWARPGSGWYSQAMAIAMARKGYRCALGSVYPYDPTIPSVAYASWFIRRNVRPGAVVILHDGGSRGIRTARTLQNVLPWLNRHGYRVVSLSELVTMPEGRRGR
jgi:peptidoglycan/xylan/chitin deacetylase (PgdA/CDA1 family)